jgi:hypothetical protein
MLCTALLAFAVVRAQDADPIVTEAPIEPPPVEATGTPNPNHIIITPGPSPTITPTLNATPTPPPCQRSVPAGDTTALISAIEAANAMGDLDVICLANHSTYTLTQPIFTDQWGGQSGLPGVNSPIVLIGNGATLQRAPNAPRFRILYISPNGSLDAQHITITGGRTFDGGEDYNMAGGGLMNQGILKLRDATISNNTAIGPGGGLMTFGAAELDNVTITGNTSNEMGGGIMAIDSDGGNRPPLVIRNSTIASNQVIATDERGLDGGGVATFVPTTIEDTTISSNQATFIGGGLYLRDQAILRNTILTGNSAYAGTIFYQPLYTESTTVDMEGVTIADNNGGGIINSGQMDIRASRIINNRPGHVGSTWNGIVIGGIRNEESAEMTISGSCIAGNLIPNITTGNWTDESDTLGLYNSSPNPNVIARNNWWGSADGPFRYDSALGTYVGMGEGIIVEENVNNVIQPFLTAPPLPGCPTLAPRPRMLGNDYNSSTGVSITLTWVDLIANETGFVIERKLASSPNWTPVTTLPANAETYTDTGLTCNTRYEYRVAAVYANSSRSRNTWLDARTLLCP